MASVREGFLRPFSSEGRLDTLLLALFLLVNGIVLGNAIVYEAGLGYDACMHQRYVGTLARGHLPGPRDTREFFSPPLPYLAPAAAVALALGLRLLPAIKAAQVLNVAWSAGLCIAYELASPGSTACWRQP